MEGPAPAKESGAETAKEQDDAGEPMRSNVCVSTDELKEPSESSVNGTPKSAKAEVEVTIVQKTIVTAEFAKISNGILKQKNATNSPIASDAEVGEKEDVVLLDEAVKNNGTYQSDLKCKVRKGPPPQLLPLEQGSTVNGEGSNNRETPTRRAALKSAEITKVMSQIKSRSYAEDDMAVVEVTMGLRDSDATQVTIKKAVDPSINHCLNCNKIDCLVYQTTGRYSKSELNFCSKRCVQQYFKYGQIHYVSSRDDGSAEQSDSSSRTTKTVQQDIVIEPDIQTSPDLMDTSDDGGSAGINGSGAHVGVEAVIESAARESLTCETCRVSLYDVNDPLVWEAKEFCSLKCLSFCVRTIGFSCNQCRARVGVSVLGKLCVRFGSSIRQFCSSPCLEKFKLNHKLCTQCQVNMLNKDMTFCSLACEDLHRRLRNKSEFLGQRVCAVCCMKKTAREQISLNGQTHWLCSEPCKNAFCFANKTLTCGLCHQPFDSKALPRYVSRNIEPGKAMELSDLTWFCSLTCHTTSLLKQRTIVACTWCRVKKYNVDMIRKIMSVPPPSQGPKDQRPLTKEAFFCSMYCLDLHQPVVQPKVPLKMNEPATGGSRITNPAPSAASVPSNPPAGVVTFPAAVHSTSSVASTAAPSATTTSAVTTPAVAATTKSAAGGPASCVPLEVHHKIITVPPKPKEMKNKSTWCRPRTDAASVPVGNLKTDGQAQTDSKADARPVFIPVPIPVPIYVPVPMGMYYFPCPKPFPFPLPIPAPVLLPVSPEKIPAIEQTIKELQGESSASHPFEEEVLLLAEAVGKSSQSDSVPAISVSQSAPAENDPPREDEEDDEDLEQSLSSIKIVMLAPSGTASRKRSASDSNSPALTETPPAKRARDTPVNSSVSSSEGEDSDHSVSVPSFSQGSFQRGVGERAWFQWARRRRPPEDEQVRAKRPRRLSSMNIDDMNAHLIEFVRNVRKPSGEKYRPDILLYFIYGLQLTLGSENRHEKLFMDAALEPFQEELDRCLEPFCQSLIKAITEEKNASFSSCLRESHLWECQQLGVHTPFVLVFTMLYFNTKYFRLYTLEQHEQLSFTSIHKVNKKAVQVANNQGVTIKGAQKISCLQLVHLTTPGLDSKLKKPLDQPQNLDRPTECPIKHYNFYLSKCPDSVRMRKDVYYLIPETSCTPDSPVWYSTQAVPRQILGRMLRRVLLVEDVMQNLCV